jgi:uncharacterized protein (DUF736 family)
MHGQLWPNDKGHNPKRPDYRGMIHDGNMTRPLAGWLHFDRRGRQYVSIVVGDEPVDPSRDVQSDGERHALDQAQHDPRD